MLTERDEHLDAVVEFQVDEDELVTRLLSRGRSDDTEDVIRSRQQVYRDETFPLLDHYRSIGSSLWMRRALSRRSPTAWPRPCGAVGTVP